MAQFNSKNRIVSLLIMLLTATTVMIAAPRTVEQARQAAMQQMKKHGSKKAQGVSGAVTPKLIYSKAKKNAKVDDVAYYVFSYGNDLGYTIVSGDDRLPAIVGYTDNGNYDVENLPSNLKSFMQAYQDFAETATDEQIAEIKAWKANAASHAAVAPFMEEKWNQTAPYNNMCPEYQSGEQSVTGCVATAMAQILHYYKCPDNLKTTIPAYTTKSYGITMSAISAGETYDWANMPNVYTASATQAQKDAVAKLMLNVGCAVKMDYGPSSGATGTPEAFTKYFGMDQDLVRYCDRKGYQIAEWDYILYNEIEAKRPVYYNGQSTGGGHAFVIHGYEDGLYYVNWGWGGYYDGYFDITILNPNSNQGAGASASKDGYNLGNGMIIGLQPDNGVVDETCPVFTVYSLDVKNNTIAINNGNVTASANITVLNFNPVENTRYVSVGFMDDNLQIHNVATPKSVTVIAASPNGNSYTGSATCDISLPCVDGLYKLSVIESVDQKNWMLSSTRSDFSPVYIKVQNGTASIVTPSSSLTATIQLNQASGGYAGMSNTIDITVNNTGDKEYYNKIYVMISTSETMPEGYTFASGVTAPANGSTTINFSYTPPSSGTYNFWILDANLNEIGKNSITFTASEAPILSFVSIKCTNVSGEKVYADFQNNQVEMDKVNDNKAEFTFEIKNDGGYYEGNFWLYEYNAAAKNWLGHLTKLQIPSHATTAFNFTIEGEDGCVVGAMLAANGDINISELASPIRHNIKDSNSYYPFRNCEIAYLAVPNGISNITSAKPLIITTGRNMIKLTANTDSNVKIVNISGATVANIGMNAGEQTTINVPAGIYIVNGTKVIVK